MKHHFKEHYTLAALRTRGFNATLVDFKYSEYGILVDEPGCNFLRLQIQDVHSGRVSLCGYIQNRMLDSCGLATRTTVEVCDCIVAVRTRQQNGGDLIDYYIIPTIWAEQIDQHSVVISEIPIAKNNFDILHNCKDQQYVFSLFANVCVPAN